MGFVVGIILQLVFRVRQLFLFSKASLEVGWDRVSLGKDQLVRRMFWGRGTLYKNSFHAVVTVLTSLFLITGILQQVRSVEAESQALEVNYGAIGNNDLLTQGSNINTVLAVNEQQVNYEITNYKVKQGDTLQSIADKFDVSKDTVRWANDDVISPYNDNVDPGWNLKIPEMNGVLYEVKSGQSLKDVVEKTEGNRFDIIELNNLVPPDYSVTAGQQVFVPNGELPPPPPLVPQPQGIPQPDNSGYVDSGYSVNQTLRDFPLGTFDDPLTHPQCAGYGYSRGFAPWHKGVDLTHATGCPIRASAAGRVRYVGWYPGGAGYSVIIDHGSGVETHYYHGTGDIWVKQGEYVSKGQDIMFMGCTGNCSGIHLHLTLRVDGRSIDPAPYIPYRRP